MLNNHSKILKGFGLLFVGAFFLLSAFQAEINAREIRVFPVPPKNSETCTISETSCDLLRAGGALPQDSTVVRAFSPQVEFLIEDSLMISVELPISSILKFTISDGIVTIVGDGTFIEVDQKDVQFGFAEDALVVQLRLESTNVTVLRGSITILTDRAGNPMDVGQVEVGGTYLIQELDIIRSFKTDHLNLRGKFEMILFENNQSDGVNLFDLIPNSVLNGQLIAKPVQGNPVEIVLNS